MTPRPRAWTGGRAAAIGAGLGLAAALLLAFLAIWVVVPAPTLPLLTLGVAVPELSPLLSAVALLFAVLLAMAPSWGRVFRPARQAAPAARVARAAAAIALLAAAVLAIPLAQLPGTLSRFDAAMARLDRVGPEIRAPAPLGMRESRFSLRDLVFGIDRGASRVTRGVRVVDSGGRTLTADLYTPADAPADAHERPILVQIYGGAWQRGAPGDNETFARYFASRGYVVAAIDYRHAPASRWPAQLADVTEALNWLRAHAREFGGNPEAMALVGRSSGAQLALVAAYREGPRKIAAVVSIYGPVDLEDGWRMPPRPDPLPVRPVLEAYLGGTPDQVPAQYREASPLTYVRADVPPTLLVYGERDHIVEARFARRLDQQLTSAGAVSVLLTLPWAEHAFDLLPSGLGAQVALFYTERFLARALLPRP